jgi:hypothetical protein
MLYSYHENEAWGDFERDLVVGVYVFDEAGGEGAV